MSWIARIRRFLGGKPQAPAPAARPSQAPASLPPLPGLPRQASVKYMKERQVRRTGSVHGPDYRKRRITIGSIAAALVLLPIAGFVALNILWPTTIPAELQGTWRTEEPRYATRRFELLDDQVVFQTGDSAFAVARYPVIRVRRSRSSRGTLYRVRYSIEEGGIVQFSFIFDRERAQIRLVNQTDFSWARTGPPSPRPRFDAIP